LLGADAAREVHPRRHRAPRSGDPVAHLGRLHHLGIRCAQLADLHGQPRALVLGTEPRGLAALRRRRARRAPQPRRDRLASRDPREARRRRGSGGGRAVVPPHRGRHHPHHAGDARPPSGGTRAVMARKRRVLSVASECAPLIKTGGLADVVGALPDALAPYGWSSRVLLPAYPSVIGRMPRSRRLWQTEDLFGGPAAVRATTIDGFDVMLLDA